MIFDSVYDIYRGVITYIRVVDGQFTPRERIKMMSTGATHELLEIGVISPEPVPTGGPRRRRGRLPDHRREGRPPVPGRRHRHRRGEAGAPSRSARYRDPQADGLLRACIRSTARTTRCCATRSTGCGSTTPRWSTSRSPRAALGFGFRCGFLGLLHLEITRDRLEREFDLELISTAPNVVYRVVLEDGAEHVVTNPSDWPSGQKIAEIYEPVVKAMMIAPSEYIGAIMELCQERRGSAAAAWTTCPRPASNCATRCRSPRSSSTSSTS